jgi:hypothetical protein
MRAFNHYIRAGTGGVLNAPTSVKVHPSRLRLASPLGIASSCRPPPMKRDSRQLVIRPVPNDHKPASRDLLVSVTISIQT